MPHHPLGQFDSHHGGLFPCLRLAVSTVAARANSPPPPPLWLTGPNATALLAATFALRLWGYTAAFAFLICGLPLPDWAARSSIIALPIGSALGAVCALTAVLCDMADDFGMWLNGSTPPPPGPASSRPSAKHTQQQHAMQDSS